MAQDIQTKYSGLRHQTNDQETALHKPIREERSNKCLVFALAALVILCAALLIFACIVRVRSPEVKLISATLNQINYSTSSPVSFNATVITHLSMRNPNYGGGFGYENSTVSVVYDGVRVGDGGIGSDTVKARETKGMNVTLNVRSGKLTGAGSLISDINSGTLNLTTHAKLSGTVQLLKIINKRKIVEMACTMNLNLTSHVIQGIQC